MKSCRWRASPIDHLGAQLTAVDSGYLAHMQHVTCASSEIEPRVWRPSPEQVEAARKRAALATEIVVCLARLRISITNSAEYERRHGGFDRECELRETWTHFEACWHGLGVDAENAHARWDRLRQLATVAANAYPPFR